MKYLKLYVNIKKQSKASAFHFCIVCLSVFGVGCSSAPAKLHSKIDAQPSEVAVVVPTGKCQLIAVDGVNVKKPYSPVEVLAGSHHLRITAITTPLIKDTVEYTLDLKGGRNYGLGFQLIKKKGLESLNPFACDRFVWIQDNETLEVLAGYRPVPAKGTAGAILPFITGSDVFEPVDHSKALNYKPEN